MTEVDLVALREFVEDAYRAFDKEDVAFVKKLMRRFLVSYHRVGNEMGLSLLSPEETYSYLGDRRKKMLDTLNDLINMLRGLEHAHKVFPVLRTKFAHFISNNKTSDEMRASYDDYLTDRDDGSRSGSVHCSSSDEDGAHTTDPFLPDEVHTPRHWWDVYLLTKGGLDLTEVYDEDQMISGLIGRPYHERLLQEAIEKGLSERARIRTRALASFLFVSHRRRAPLPNTEVTDGNWTRSVETPACNPSSYSSMTVFQYLAERASDQYTTINFQNEERMGSLLQLLGMGTSGEPVEETLNAARTLVEDLNKWTEELHI